VHADQDVRFLDRLPEGVEFGSANERRPFQVGTGAVWSRKALAPLSTTKLSSLMASSSTERLIMGVGYMASA
jgi:hypothetical protein